MKRRPITGRFHTAIIPCGGAKNAPPPYRQLEAQELYKGSPFRVNLEHARRAAFRVFIMSAKHGLLPLTAKVDPYEAYLPDLPALELADLLQRIAVQAAFLDLGNGQVVSYLPKAYQHALNTAVPWLVCSRPYAGLNMLGMIGRLSQENKDAQRLVGR